MNFYEVRIKNIIRETSDAVIISFDIPEHLQNIFAYTQGQYLTLKATINGTEIRRSYSLCSSPLENCWEVGIKKVPQGIFSTYANEVLKIGDSIELAPPAGKFYTALNNTQSKNYIAYAAGSGITPIVSLIKTTLVAEPASNFTLVYGNKNRNSVILKETLEGLKNKFLHRFNLIYLFSQEQMDMPLFKGRVDKEKVLALQEHLIPAANFNEHFICGPESMILGIKELLTNKNIAASNIHFELFGTSQNTKEKRALQHAQANHETICKVIVQQDGVKVAFDLAFDTDNVLDAASKKGMDLPYACKGGVCCTCKAKLIAGKVTMDVNYGLEPDEIEAGYILTCQAFPATESIVVSFDD
jgi:ring-1,2-phenylacetyl-CoA epoxidase subunit PaaE